VRKTKTLFVLLIDGFITLSVLYAWERPFNLSATRTASLFPRMVVDHNGIIHAAWTEFESSTVANIYYRKYDREGWSAKENLSKGNWSSRESNIAVDAAGNVYVAWISFADDKQKRGLAVLTIHVADGRRELEYLPFTMNSSWDELKLPSIASDEQGNLSVVTYTGHRRVWGRNRDNGKWSDWKVINSRGVFSASESACVTYGRDGKFYAAWPEYAMGRDRAYSIYYTVRRAGGEWDPPKTTRHDGVPLDNPQAHPKIVVDEKGDMHMVWMNHPPGILEIFYQRWDNAGKAWVDRSFASRRGGYSTLPTITLTRSGTRYIAWSLGPYGNLYNAQYNFAPRGESFRSVPLHFFPAAIVNPYFTQIESGGPNENVFFIYEQGPQSGKDVFITSLMPIVLAAHVHPPVNLSGRGFDALKIDQHFRNKFNLLQWQDNPENDREGITITGFRVYRREEAQEEHQSSLLTQLDAAARNYMDYNIDGQKSYIYMLSALDGNGNESERVAVTVAR